MNPIVTKILFGVLQAMPQVVQEVEAAIKTAESPEAASQKIGSIVDDTAKLLQMVKEFL